MLLACCRLAGSGAVAESTDGSAKPAKPPERAPLTPEREAAAITFVRQHHPELVDLLNQLKETKPAEYQTAIRELFQTSERLAQLREQDPQRYELELAAWKTKSRIQLLAARSTMSADKSFEDQLHAALVEQADIRLKLMKLERDRIADRLEKLDKSIEQYQASQATEIRAAIRSLAETHHRLARANQSRQARRAGARRPARNRTRARRT